MDGQHAPRALRWTGGVRIDGRAVVRGILAAALCGVGTLHFVPSSARTMAAIVPPAVERRSPVSTRAIVQITGVCELAGAAGLLLPATRPVAGAALIVFYACVFPANAYAARHPERFGRVAVPFGRRLAFQVFVVLLTAWGSFEPRGRRR